jgi:hypothetical protein
VVGTEAEDADSRALVDVLRAPAGSAASSTRRRFQNDVGLIGNIGAYNPRVSDWT